MSIEFNFDTHKSNCYIATAETELEARRWVEENKVMLLELAVHRNLFNQGGRQYHGSVSFRFRPRGPRAKSMWGGYAHDSNKRTAHHWDIYFKLNYSYND